MLNLNYRQLAPGVPGSRSLPNPGQQGNTYAANAEKIHPAAQLPSRQNPLNTRAAPGVAPGAGGHK